MGEGLKGKGLKMNSKLTIKRLYLNCGIVTQIYIGERLISQTVFFLSA
jgi:hypothetical protein